MTYMYVEKVSFLLNVKFIIRLDVVYIVQS